MHQMLNLSNAAEAAEKMPVFGPIEPLEDYENKGIYIGKGLIYKSPIIIRFDKLINPHVAIIGMSGSGKSYLLKSIIIRRHIIEGINAFVIDWNGEYESTMEFLAGTVHRIGKDCRIGASFLGDKSKTLEYIAESAAHAVNADAEDVKHIRRSVSEMLESEHKDDKEKAKAGSKEMATYSMLEKLHIEKFFSNDGLKIEDLLNGANSLDLSMLESDMQREMIVHFILQALVEHMHKLQINGRSRLMIVLDEAWRSVRDGQLVHRIYREGRKYGIGIVTATQQISDTDSGILAGSACTFIFKMQGYNGPNALTENGFLGKEEAEELANAGIGRCAVRLLYRNGTRKPFLIDRVDGLSTSTVRLTYGDDMYVEIALDQIENASEKLELGQKRNEEIRAIVEESDGRIDLAEFIRRLIVTGLDRPSIISFFRLLGLEDMVVLKAYENAKSYKISIK